MTDSEKKLNQTWYGMKYRCYSKKLDARTARSYRDKGIRVCDEWLNDFNSFKEWALANGYKPGLTIDRIDPDGNYEPSNCRWITRSENSRRANSKEEKRFYVAKGETAKYSQKFEPTEILSDAMTYEDAREFLKQNYCDDPYRYKVVKSRLIAPKEAPAKPKGIDMTDFLIKWVLSQDVNKIVHELDEGSQFVVASVLHAFAIEQILKDKGKAE